MGVSSFILHIGGLARHLAYASKQVSKKKRGYDEKADADVFVYSHFSASVGDVI